MEVLRRCPLAIAQRLVHCAIAVSTAVLDRVTKTMSVALLLMNNLDNSKQKRSNLLSPAPPPYSWSLLGKFEGPAPSPSSKISWSFDLAWNLAFLCTGLVCFIAQALWSAFRRPTHAATSICLLYSLNDVWFVLSWQGGVSRTPPPPHPPAPCTTSLLPLLPLSSSISLFWHPSSLTLFYFNFLSIFFFTSFFFYYRLSLFCTGRRPWVESACVFNCSIRVVA